MSDQLRPGPAHWAVVHPARHLPVVSGANLGDPIAGEGLCEPGDVYRLVPDAAGMRLRLGLCDGGGRAVAEGSEIGAPGEAIRPQSHFTFMSADGEQVEAILLSVGETGAEYLLPLSPLSPRTDYTLLAARPADGSLPLTDLICVSFAAGTRITLPDGRQERIEALAVGDRVLTRDHGPQEIRWIGRATLRAKGAFAPVVVRPGVLGNGSKLIVSPHHRLFLYQRGTPRVGGMAEILVQAKHLVDDATILRREGGFVDYFSLVFDRHEIVFAEGIAAESLMVNPATVEHLPPELSEELRRRFPRLSQTQHFGTEIGRDAVAGLGGIGIPPTEEG
ncbi:Hint domain-containing protein [Defluviimonas denitrificans]|uniref:Hint domain-containing protein n=1 Tax=Albidovulum denitrificans TaxID=404881 RepID=A0A2S8SA22_9RHOB|nr:Hint domain-containing protein [Defluviimonas denitrificans]PQV57623.1 Hint domain-containing protein [Defluviimonas denitrificans]